MERTHTARILYGLLAWGLVIGLLIQVSLIGLWLFSGQPTLAIHMEFGHLIFLGVFALLILAFVGQLPSPMRLATAALSVITAIQTEVFALIPGSPLRAFHTVLPLVIFLLAAYLARSSTSFVRVRLGRPTLPLSAGESRAH